MAGIYISALVPLPGSQRSCLHHGIFVCFGLMMSLPALASQHHCYHWYCCWHLCNYENRGVGRNVSVTSLPTWALLLLSASEHSCLMAIKTTTPFIVKTVQSSPFKTTHSSKINSPKSDLEDHHPFLKWWWSNIGYLKTTKPFQSFNHSKSVLLGQQNPSKV